MLLLLLFACATQQQRESLSEVSCFSDPLSLTIADAAEGEEAEKLETGQRERERERAKRQHVCKITRRADTHADKSVQEEQRCWRKEA